MIILFFSPSCSLFKIIFFVFSSLDFTCLFFLILSIHPFFFSPFPSSSPPPPLPPPPPILFHSFITLFSIPFISVTLLTLQSNIKPGNYDSYSVLQLSPTATSLFSNPSVEKTRQKRNTCSLFQQQLLPLRWESFQVDWYRVKEKRRIARKAMLFQWSKKIFPTVKEKQRM